MRIRRIEGKCTNCMLCVQDCISAVWKDIDGIPKVVAPDDCNRCSHCLAVCPQEAIEHDGLDHMQIKRIDKGLIHPDVFETITRGRRSVRRYKEKMIPDELVEKILHLVNHTPTASNSQNVDYIVVSNKKILREISTIIFGFSKKIF